MSATYIIVNLIDKIFAVYSYIILFDVLLSWVLPPTNALKQFLDFLVAPVLGPIRKMLQPLMAKSSIPLDFSPILAYVLIMLIRQLLAVLWTAIL